MKKIILAAFVIASTASVFAQNIELVLTDSLRFPVTTEISSNMETASLYNPGPYVIEVVDIDFFEIYGDAPFTVLDTNFVLQPGDTQKVNFTFLPEHNIHHKMAAVVKTKSGFGHYIIPLSGQGRYSMNYYSTTENKSEQQLKSALNIKLAQGYNSLGYNTARDQMFMNVDNKKNNGQSASVNTLECIYTGTTITGYSDRQAAQNGNPQFNTEHTFPQGHFNSNEPMRSDMHHLFPTTNTSNSQRGNDPFGLVSNPTWNSGGSKSDGSTFEPRDAQKGATARAMMYFVLRYQDYAGFFQSQETILRDWHDQFPPTAIDEKRNSDIANLQNSRNPFVDYPQFAERITSLVTNATPVSVKELYASDDTIKLAAASGRFQYRYVLYNAGNDDVNLSSFSLSDTSLKFVNAPGSISLEPNQSLAVDISFKSDNSYNAALSYMTNIAGQVNVSVPIISGSQPQVGMEEISSRKSIEVYPNPANQHLRIGGVEDGSEVILINMTGQVYEKVLQAGKVDLTQIPAGFYSLKLKAKPAQGGVKVLIQ